MPVASFDFSKAEDVRRCFHWSNLQPLWQNVNKYKGARIPTDREWDVKKGEWVGDKTSYCDYKGNEWL